MKIEIMHNFFDKKKNFHEMRLLHKVFGNRIKVRHDDNEAAEISGLILALCSQVVGSHYVIIPPSPHTSPRMSSELSPDERKAIAVHPRIYRKLSP